MRWLRFHGLLRPHRLFSLFVVSYALIAMPLGNFGCQMPLPEDVQLTDCDDHPHPLHAVTQSVQLLPGGLLATGVTLALTLCCQTTCPQLSATLRTVPPPTPPPRAGFSSSAPL